MNLTGQAKTDIQIVDLSVIYNTGLKGIVGVLGVTERGPVNKPTLIGSWLQYTRIFGGLIEDDDFPLLCRRALESGAKLKITRIAHYADITDATTIDGVIASFSAPAINVEAVSFGTWGNSLSITITDNDDLIPNSVNVDIELAGSGIVENYTIDKDASQGVINSTIVNASSLIGAFTVASADSIPITAKTAFTLGDNPAAYTDNDYIGDVTTVTGIHTFDEESDITKICIPAKAVPVIDTALITYADMRKDIIAVIRTPVGLSGTKAVEYRLGKGIYSHQPFDSWRAIMTTGGLVINHPDTGEVIEISEIGDVLGSMSRRDNEYAEWFAFSGPKRGRIQNTLGVVYNLGSSARQLEADNVDVNGINAIIEHPSFGVVAWGNSTLQRANTLLKHANVAELLVFLTRELRPIIQSELFEPNDISTWKTIHRKVTPILDQLVEQRGIFRYLYQGDQDIDDVRDAQVNSTEDIDAGRYTFHLFIAPTVALKYLGVKVIVTNSGVDFESLTV